MIVPDGVLFGSSNAHKELRRMLVEEHKLDAVVKLPAGVFKPYAGVSTAILFFTKTNRAAPTMSGSTTCRPTAFAGRQAQPAAGRRQARCRSRTLSEDEHTKNNLPDVLRRWAERDGAESERARTEQSFCVPKADIAAQGYDLSLNRYKEIVHEEVEHRSPTEILDELDRLEKEITDGIAQLREMLAGGAA